MTHNELTTRLKGYAFNSAQLQKTLTGEVSRAFVTTSVRNAAEAVGATEQQVQAALFWVFSHFNTAVD